MQRPSSIVLFERFYFGALVLDSLKVILNWSAYKAHLLVRPSGRVFPDWVLPVTLVFSAALALILWHFVARRGSNVARWIVAAIVVLDLLSLPRIVSDATAALTSPLLSIIAVTALALEALAIWMLFRTDAKPWFRSDPGTATK